MDAGRELDILVAEKVFGFEVKAFHQFGNMTLRYINPRDPSLGHWCELPHFSTTMTAAWNIVELMTDLTLPDWCTFEMHRSMNQHDIDSWGYTVLFGEQYNPTHQYERRVWAPTAPLAICLAALKVTESLLLR
jgi:hypothetical protein